MEGVMSATAIADHGVEILARTIRPDEGGMSAEAARAILSFRLANHDKDRVNELASKARAGALTAAERAELDDYERITALLELMQSKARLSLKQSGQLP
jgi:hypothetical protein